MSYVFPIYKIPVLSVAGLKTFFLSIEFIAWVKITLNICMKWDQILSVIPFFFNKPADAVFHLNSQISYPPVTKNLHHEIELVVAIGEKGNKISKSEALNTYLVTQWVWI
ncbi:MAG: hypothetical protein CM1200mP28_10830 [Deltaproteobacteria bacterium]|nr:MAG: hypothetical protein CM1200mP28_10830 [Deltaproteobacteria bacterium]